MPSVASAVHCGRYDCGHVTRSDDRAIKRALVIYLAREAGLAPSTADEAADVLAVLALMREGRPCSEVREWRTAGVTRATAPATPATTDGPRIRVTPQMCEVATLIAQGYDIPEVAEATYRSVETVRSLLARCRQATAAHSSHAAVVTLARWGYVAL
jgi:DNA-binding NarL/FixJ family response regulator